MGNLTLNVVCLASITFWGFATRTVPIPLWQDRKCLEQVSRLVA